MEAPADPPDDPGPVDDGFGTPQLDLADVRRLFERLARSSLGRRAVRSLRPREDAAARLALERVREMQLLARASDEPGLAGLVDVRPALESAHEFGRPLEAEELAGLLGFLEATARLARWLRERRKDVPELARLAEQVPDLVRLYRGLAERVDAKGELRADASPRLARLRREERALDEQIGRIVAKVAATPALRPVLVDTRVYRRGGRRVLAVKARSSGRVPGIVHDRSSSGETAFVEPREAIDPGNRLTGLMSDARAEEQRILVELTRDVLAREEDLGRASDAMAELELAVIANAFCQRFDARVPEVPAAGEGGLVLRSARHPLLVAQLQDGQLEEVVPIDVRLGDDFDLLVITGPNTGGKTLALKTVGTAAFCVRMGWPVCCGEGSRVPLYEGIVADIGDAQEIRQSLSTFAGHLVRIREGLERAGPTTLVLLDELGGGTDPDEGAALGHALLEHLLERGVPTLVTTHIGRLKEFAFRNARVENASVEFDAETLRPRYRLLVGTPGESNALHIAAHIGLPPELVERARARLERHDRELLELMADVRGAREHAERLRSAAESKLEEAARTEGDVRAREEELERRGELLEAEAQRGLEERVAGARRELERAFALLDQLPAERARALREVLQAADAQMSGASLTDRRRAFLDGLRKGELVFIPRYKQRCLVQRVDRGKREVSVRLGKMTLSVPFDEVTWYESL